MHKQTMRILILDDDTRRHDWFLKRLRGKHVDIASNVLQARELLTVNHYHAIFLDHNLLPQHYTSVELDDERTGYAIASWLAANPELQGTASITVHTRNADGAMRMIFELRRSGRQAVYVPFPLLDRKTNNLLEIDNILSRSNSLASPAHSSQPSLLKKPVEGTPYFAEYLFALLLPAEDREAILGDTYENYAEIKTNHNELFAKIWYYKQVAASAWPMIRKGFR